MYFHCEFLLIGKEPTSALGLGCSLLFPLKNSTTKRGAFAGSRSNACATLAPTPFIMNETEFPDFQFCFVKILFNNAAKFGVCCSLPASPSTVHAAVGFHKTESRTNFLFEMVPIASVYVVELSVSSI